MIRKIIYLTSGLTLVTMLLFGTSAFSYVSTMAQGVHDTVHDAVPVEFEIERAKGMVKDLEPEIRKNMHVIAKEEVEVEQLNKQISKLEKKLEKSQTDLMRLQKDVASGKSQFQYASRTYTAQQVRTDLANRFERFKTNDATLASLQQILDARTRSLGAAREKLDEMMVAKRQLRVEVENLEAQLTMVELAQTTSDYHFDDSRLGRAKELIQDIKTRLDVAERLANSSVSHPGEIQLDSPSTEKIENEVAEYFGISPDAAQIAADSTD